MGKKKKKEIPERNSHLMKRAAVALYVLEPRTRNSDFADSRYKVFLIFLNI